MSSLPLKDVAVIVLGRNARAYVEGSLASLERAPWRGVTRELVYVDNGSSDGTVQSVRQKFPDVTVFAHPANLGFCKACNDAARKTPARHYLFLNDDTVVLEDAVPLLVEFLDRRPEVGSVGSRLLNPDMTDQWSGRSFPTLGNALLGRRSLLARYFPNAPVLRRYLHKDKTAAGEPYEVDWVSAAAQMIRSETFHRCGGFREDYYYWHEAVLCDAIRRQGQSVFLHPRSKVIHYEGKGSGPRPYKVRRFHIIDFHRGAYRCYCEHYGLGRLSPRRWLVAAAALARAGLLLAMCRVSTLLKKSEPA